MECCIYHILLTFGQELNYVTTFVFIWVFSFVPYSFIQCCLITYLGEVYLSLFFGVLYPSFLVYCTCKYSCHKNIQEVLEWRAKKVILGMIIALIYSISALLTVKNENVLHIVLGFWIHSRGISFSLLKKEGDWAGLVHRLKCAFVY